MKSGRAGKSISPAEVTNISPNGVWILVDGEELFMPFEHFPWFEAAPIAAILNLEWPSRDHLYWPQLDVDISISSVRSPEKFPLISKVPAPNKKANGRRSRR